MSTSRAGFAGRAVLALVAGFTTWSALWSWAAFATRPGEFLGPLLLLGLVVALSGSLARWWRLPAPAVVLVQVVLSGAACSLLLTGSPVPLGGAWARLTTQVEAAMDSARAYAAPVPDNVPGIHPLLIPCGLLCLLLVDVLACTLRRVPLAGLPLLLVYSIPVSMVGGSIAWWVFTVSAAGFLCMLFLQEVEQLSRWGRPLGPPLAEDHVGFAASSARVRASATAAGGMATVLALALPALVPTLDLHLIDGGVGPGSGSDIKVENPMVDLRRDLRRGDDIPLLRLTTDDPSPEYLRISVLNRFSENEWSSGDRDVPADHQADGEMPALAGVSPELSRRDYQYAVDVTPAFKSSWLPTQAPISRIDASGDWRYDDTTMDFISGDDAQTTAGLGYTMTGVKVDLDTAAMARAPSSVGLVSHEFTDLPTELPGFVRTLAADVTQDAPTRFEKAQTLQAWFRDTGGFTYSLADAPSGNGTDDLVAFLSDGPGGRTGYCEQFASAMAVMARSLGIPARVAVGFLEPRSLGQRTWEYSAYDLHAWPELYFAGSGWVPFEPTPARRVPTVPDYTKVQAPGGGATSRPDVPDASASAPARAPRETDLPTADPAAARSSDEGDGIPWLAVGGGGLALALVAVLALLPGLVRRSQRERRLGSGPEQAWQELRATAIDLGVSWPEGRSPRETRSRVVRCFGAPVDSRSPERPAQGPHQAADAVAAMDRVVDVLERSRYARGGAGQDVDRADVEACLAALEGGATRAARRRAQWLPRSVVDRGRGGSRGQVRRAEESTALVDQVT